MATRILMIAAVLVAACTPSERPELTCQKRLVQVRDGSGSEADAKDPFQAKAYAALDLSGCTPQQRATIARLAELARQLPILTERNNEAATSNNPSAHNAAFQKMNDTLIQLDDLEQGAKADLETMLTKPAD